VLRDIVHGDAIISRGSVTPRAAAGDDHDLAVRGEGHGMWVVFAEALVRLPVPNPGRDVKDGVLGRCPVDREYCLPVIPGTRRKQQGRQAEDHNEILGQARLLGRGRRHRGSRSRGSDGGLTGHGCARSAEIVGRIVLRGHPLHAANACVKLLNHMVQYMTTRLDTSFAALSDATRRGVLEQLGRADASITDLAEKFHMTLTGMKKHVGVLEQAGLVTTKKIGRVRTCRLGPRRLVEETAWLERYRQRWDARFDELDKVVEELTRKEKSDERKNRK